MLRTYVTGAQLIALMECDLSQSTVEQYRAFEAVLALAMEGKLVDVDSLALALAIPAMRPPSAAEAAHFAAD